MELMTKTDYCFPIGKRQLVGVWPFLIHMMIMHCPWFWIDFLGDLMFDEDDSRNRYDDFITVRFLLASKMRPLLLLLLSDMEYDLNAFREELDKPSASILHGLKELERINLIKKNFKRYSLSSKGVLCSASLKKLFMDLYIFEINRDFWLNHSIESIPRDSFRNTYLLKDSVFV